MLIKFPRFYPDELFYSACARYAKMMNYTNNRDVIKDLLGVQGPKINYDFPLHLLHFISVLPVGHPYTADEIINQHTLLPYFAPFVEPERIMRIRDILKSGVKGKRQDKLTGSTIPTVKYLQYCPACAENDRKTYGEAYWHRVHQIFGNCICHTHKTFLKNSTVFIGDRRRNLVSAEDSIEVDISGQLVDLSVRENKLFLDLAVDISWLFNQTNMLLGQKPLGRRYKELCYGLGYVRPNGRYAIQKISENIGKHYSNDFLAALQCQRLSNHKFLKQIMSTQGSATPLKHLLLFNFLGCSAVEFFTPILGHNRVDESDTVKKKVSPKTPYKARKDWNQRDIVFAKRIRGVGEKLRKWSGRPIRITFSRLIKVTGFSSRHIQDNKRNLPRTFEVIGEYEETSAEWAKRCIEWAIEHYRKENKIPSSKTELLELAKIQAQHTRLISAWMDNIIEETFGL